MVIRQTGILALMTLLACGGRGLGGAEAETGSTPTSTTGSESDSGDTGDVEPPATGEVLWCVVHYESFQDDIPVDIELDPQGNIVVAGVTDAHPYYNEAKRWVAMFDAEGEHLWSFAEGADGERESVRDLAITADGGIVVLGFATGDADFTPYFARLSSTGAEQWVYAPEPGTVLDAMVLGDANQIIVLGTGPGVEPMTGQNYVWRVDADTGEFVDAVPRDNGPRFPTAAARSGDDVWVTGEAWIGMPPDPVEQKAWLSRFDASLSMPLSVDFTAEGQDATSPTDIEIGPDQTVWMTGISRQGVPPDPPSNFQGWVIHADASGEILEQLVLNDGGDDFQGGNDLAFDPWGNLLIASTAFDQGYIAKRSPAGETLWLHTLELDLGEPLQRSTINAITFDSDGNIILAGSATLEGEFADAVICKLTP